MRLLELLHFQMLCCIDLLLRVIAFLHSKIPILVELPAVLLLKARSIAACLAAVGAVVEVGAEAVLEVPIPAGAVRRTYPCAELEGQASRARPYSSYLGYSSYLDFPCADLAQASPRIAYCS